MNCLNEMKDSNYCALKKKYISYEDCNNCSEYKKPNINENKQVIVD